MPRPRIYRSNAERQAAYRQRKRKRQPVQFWHKSDEWETPPELFLELEREFHFTTDVAALPDNAKVSALFYAWCECPRAKVGTGVLDESALRIRIEALGKESPRERAGRRHHCLFAAGPHRYPLVRAFVVLND